MNTCIHCQGLGYQEFFDIWGKKDRVTCPYCKGTGKCDYEARKIEIELEAEELERQRYWDCYSEGVTNARNEW